jgi:tRNA threonylcarbamoyladenosine biosynthesis protein TsaB
VRILAIETSGTTGSLALLEGPELVQRADLDPALRSARALSPGIRDLLAQVDWRPADVELVAVAIGPGSFTGLRLGVMTGKAFAYAVGAGVVGVDTLSTIAAQAPAEAHHIAAVIDAQRGDVYCAKFARDEEGAPLKRITPIEIAAADRWLAELAAGTVLTGPALVKLPPQNKAHCTIAPREAWFADAATVGRLAAARAAVGEVDDVWQLAPLYLRRSAAEEKRDAQEQL